MRRVPATPRSRCAMFTTSFEKIAFTVPRWFKVLNTTMHPKPNLKDYSLRSIHALLKTRNMAVGK